jgi:serine/threonine protein kinase
MRHPHVASNRMTKPRNHTNGDNQSSYETSSYGRDDNLTKTNSTQHIKTPLNALTTNTWEQLSKNEGFSQEFKLIRILKGGVGGDVAIFSYLGTNPEILELIGHNNDGNPVLIKALPKNNSPETIYTTHANECFLNEIRIINHMNHTNQDRLKRRAKSLTLKITDTTLIINELIQFENQSIYSDKIRRSKDLEQFISEVGQLHQIQSGHTGININFPEFRQQIENIFLSIISSQMELHETNILHLDTSPRNFVMTDNGVKIIDFGLSLTMDTTGTSEDIRFPLNPLYLYDAKAAIGEGKSIETDIYSRKIAMMEVLLTYLNINRSEYGNAITSSLNKQYISSNKDRLVKALSILEEYANKDKTVKKQFVLDIIADYRDYLTYMPTKSSQTPQAFDEADSKKFLAIYFPSLSTTAKINRNLSDHEPGIVHTASSHAARTSTNDPNFGRITPNFAKSNNNDESNLSQETEKPSDHKHKI